VGDDDDDAIPSGCIVFGGFTIVPEIVGVKFEPEVRKIERMKRRRIRIQNKTETKGV
jgi:hypothetical protein